MNSTSILRYKHTVSRKKNKLVEMLLKQYLVEAFHDKKVEVS
jgi:hypothetical protein